MGLSLIPCELISYGKYGVYSATRNIRSVHVSGLWCGRFCQLVGKLVGRLVGQLVGFAGLHLLVVFACWCVRSDCVGISYRHVRVSPSVTNYDRCVQFDLLWGAVVDGGVIGVWCQRSRCTCLSEIVCACQRSGYSRFSMQWKLVYIVPLILENSSSVLSA